MGLGIAAVACCALAAGGYWLYQEYQAKRAEQVALADQLATERKAAEDARHAAEEQSRRALEAEGRAEREQLLAEAAKREAALQAQVQSAEEARRRAESERKRLDDERQKAEDEKRAAAARAQEEQRLATARAADEAKRAAEAAKAKRAQTTLAMAGGAGNRTAAAGGSHADGRYDGVLCNFPNDPSKKACWHVELTLQNGAATGSWPNPRLGKTASVHGTVGEGGAVTLDLEGWNGKTGAELDGTLTGQLVDTHLDAQGRWANGVRIEGHWTRSAF